MARLPVPGSDDGTWGAILNDYLSQSHDTDGTLKGGSVQTAAIADAAVTEAKLSAALQTKVNAAGGTTPDATTTSKGVVQLAGDLGGTAAAPTVPGLAAKADDTAVVHLAGSESIDGSKTFTSAVTIVDPTAPQHAVSKTYVDKNLPWYNVVTEYGADNTGAADARAAIQSAIDAANAAGGGIVYLPAGDYAISYTANAGGTGAAGGLQMKGQVWLRGDGRGTRLFPTGTWSTQAGVIGIGDFVTPVGNDQMYNVRVSDMFIKAAAGKMTSGTRIANTFGILFNTYNGTTVTEPDAAHIVHDLLIWDMDTGMAFIGTDDQGMHIQRIRIRRCINQCMIVGHPDGSGGGPDNFFHALDVSSGNIGLGTAAGIEVYSSNCHFVECKVWYCKRSTAFTPGTDYKDGAGWFVAGTRNIFVACEAQDNGGHGFVLKYGKNTFTGCTADSNSYYANISGSAAINECSGFYIGGASSSNISGALAFNRSASHLNQKYGYYIDSTVRSLKLEGVAYDNEATTGAGTAADGVTWSASKYDTQVVSIVSSYSGANYTHISNAFGGATGGSGTFEIMKSSAPQEVTVTGTTLTDDATLMFTAIPGGAVRYRIEGYLKYRADAATDAKFAVRIGRNDGTSSAEVSVIWEHLSTAGAVARTMAYSSAPSTVGVASVDGAGTSGTANMRAAQITGDIYVGTTITSATVAIQSAESTAAGLGVTILTGSWLRITQMA